MKLHLRIPLHWVDPFFGNLKKKKKKTNTYKKKLLKSPARNINKISPEQLMEFTKQHYSPNRFVLSACGTQHEEIVDLAKKYFGGLTNPTQAVPKLAPPKYVGGDKRIRGDAPLTHVALCFDSGGWNSPDILSMCVLHMVLGGGSSFSPGGPGKGLYTRLYKNVLNKHHWIDSITSYNASNADAGLIGIYATAPAKSVATLTDVMASEILDIANTVPTADEVQRAKMQLKSSIFMNLENRQISMEDMGRQVMIFGKREDPISLSERIDKVCFCFCFKKKN